MKKHIIIFLTLTIFLLVFIEACGNPFFPGLMDTFSRKGSGAGGTGSKEEKGTPVVGPFGTVAWVSTLTGVDGAGSGTAYANFAHVTVDQNGNVYALGTQNSNNTFAYGTDLAAAVAGTSKDYNWVLVKYGADGKAKWAKTAAQDPEGSTLRIADAVTVDTIGNIYLAGENIDSKPAVVKYDTNGNLLLWESEVPEGIDSVRFDTVAVDNTGNVYAAGITNVPNNLVLVKYDSEGNARNKYEFTGGAVAVDATGNIYIMWFSKGIDPVLVKYDTNGIQQWACTVAGITNVVEFKAIAVDEAGNVYVTGRQSGTSLHDYGNNVTITGTSAGNNPVLVKYDSGGNAQWAYTPEESPPVGMVNFSVATVDRAGYVYVAGGQWGTCNYGNGVTVIGPSTYTNVSPLLVKYDTAGSVRNAWILKEGPDGSGFSDIALDPSSGYLYAVGYQDSKGDFDYGNGKVVAGICNENPILVKFYK